MRLAAINQCPGAVEDYGFAPPPSRPPVQNTMAHVNSSRNEAGEVGVQLHRYGVALFERLPNDVADHEQRPKGVLHYDNPVRDGGEAEALLNLPNFFTSLSKRTEPVVESVMMVSEVGS